MRASMLRTSTSVKVSIKRKIGYEEQEDDMEVVETRKDMVNLSMNERS